MVASTQTEQPESGFSPLLILPRQSRTMAVGRSGSGKSTLAEVLALTYLRRYPRARLLIVDSKPHFVAQWEVNGVSARPRYKKYDPKKMTYIPGSYRVPLDQPFKKSFDQIWRHGGRVAIVQVTKPGQMFEWNYLMQATQVFYESYGHNPPRMIWVNELADFFEVKKIGGIFWLLARAGRELQVSFLGETQRPVYIPKTVMTEATRMYLFELDNVDDWKHLVDVGIPKETIPVRKEWEFLYYDKLAPHGKRVTGPYKLGGIDDH